MRQLKTVLAVMLALALGVGMVGFTQAQMSPKTTEGQSGGMMGSGMGMMGGGQMTQMTPMMQMMQACTQMMNQMSPMMGKHGTPQQQLPQPEKK